MRNRLTKSINIKDGHDAANGKRRLKRGAALIVVLLLLAIVAILLAEFQYNMRINTMLFGNRESRLIGRYVAKAGQNAARGLIKNPSVRLENDTKWNTSLMPLYQYECLTQPTNIFAGLMGDSGLEPPESMDMSATAGQVMPAASSPQSGDTALDNCGTWSFYFPYDMEGTFLEVEIYDERSRINLNALYRYSQDDQGTPQMVENLEVKHMLMELINLQVVRKNIELEYPIEEIVQLIMDYMDFGMVEGSFDDDLVSYFDYEDSDRMVPMKDYFYDTVDEIKIIPAVSDELFDAIKDHLTVYPKGQQRAITFDPKINLNTCSVEVMYAFILSLYYDGPDLRGIDRETAWKMANEIITNHQSGGQQQNQNIPAAADNPLALLGPTVKYNREEYVPDSIKSRPEYNNLRYDYAAAAVGQPRYYRVVSTAMAEDGIETSITRVVMTVSSQLGSLYYSEE